MDEQKKTEKTYGFLWKRNKDVHPMDTWHFNKMQEVIAEPIVRGKIGIDIGCGCGYDTYIMAKNNPSSRIVSIDVSDGVYITKKLTSDLKNVSIIKCSVSDMPLKDDTFDFAYSFGVLHHTINPQKCLLEISRVLKKYGLFFAYLYEDHSENFIKHMAVRLITKIRVVTVGLHPRLLYIFCLIASPFIFIIFSLPSKLLRGFKATQDFAKKIPFNFGTGLFSLRGDLYDRLSAPVEYRFSRRNLYNMFNACGFQNINIARLNEGAGWVISGEKYNA